MSETIWSPRLERGVRPIYRAVADALERDLARGVLREGQRLPTHRELASMLSVTPLTITRAYREASRRGLIESTVGRGTFIRGEVPPLDPAHTEKGILDLSKNVVAATEMLDLEPRAIPELRAILRDADYHPAAGSLRHRMAGAAWLQRTGVEAETDRIVITPGTQQAIVAVLAATCRPGDTIAAEAMTYPRFASIAALLHLKIEPVEVDDGGVVVKSLEKALRRSKVLYCVPNFQNPTGSVMSEKRRREIAALARQRDITVIEDDVYGFLLDSPPAPIHSFAPERTCYLTGLSKSLSPSLRIGVASIPDSLVDGVTEACASITAFTSTPSVEIFAMLSESGAAERCIAAKRELITRNRNAADRVLSPRATRSHAMSPHIWLPLPESCDAHELSERARSRGIGVAPASSFAIGRNAPNAIRISLGSTNDTRALESALRTVASLIAQPRLGAGVVV